MKDSSSRTRFPGRAGDPERQHHAAVMTTTIAHAQARGTFDGNDLPCHGARRSRPSIPNTRRIRIMRSNNSPDHLEASIDLLEIEDSTTLMVPAVDGLNSEEAQSHHPRRRTDTDAAGCMRWYAAWQSSSRVVVVRRAASESELGVRTEHVRGHLELAVLLPLEHDKIFAGSGSRAS